GVATVVLSTARSKSRRRREGDELMDFHPKAHELPANGRKSARGGTLILGGGFGGASLARSLGKRGATIVSAESSMLYTPLLPDVAAGAIEPRHVAVPLRMMCPHADLLVGRAVALGEERRYGTVESEASTRG